MEMSLTPAIDINWNLGEPTPVTFVVSPFDHAPHSELASSQASGGAATASLTPMQLLQLETSRWVDGPGTTHTVGRCVFSPWACAAAVAR